MYDELTKLLDSFIEWGIPGYDCAVYRNGVCEYRHQNGYSDTVNQIPMNGKERYNLYSASKMITCTAALQLYEKGVFRLEDKLSDYLPEFETMYVKTQDGVKKAENAITIKDLFRMTAGFSYNLESPMLIKARQETEGRCPTRETMKYLAKEPLLFEPGHGWAYSLCHDVLAALVEVISGVRFGEYVKQNIFNPLGMSHSTYLLPEEELETVSTQYVFNSETRKAEICPKTIDYRLGSEYESGGAGCVSTVDDYMKFLEALRIGDVILKSETIELMSTNQLTPQQAEIFEEWKAARGYGLGVSCPKAPGMGSDFGWGGAAGAFPLIDRKHGLTFFYAQHVLVSDNDSRNIPLRKFFIEKLCAE